MQAYCYILYSKKLNRFYIGATEFMPNIRWEQHIEKIYNNKSFTAKADDWVIYLTIKCYSKRQAFAIESHIKRMKSKKYIENLNRYPEMILKLKSKYD